MIGQIAFTLLGVVVLALPVPAVIWYHRNAQKYRITMTDTLETYEVPGRLYVAFARIAETITGREMEIERVSRG